MPALLASADTCRQSTACTANSTCTASANRWRQPASSALKAVRSTGSACITCAPSDREDCCHATRRDQWRCELTLIAEPTIESTKKRLRKTKGINLRRATGEIEQS